MNIRIMVIIVALFVSNYIYGQNIYVLKSSKIHFYAGTPVEDIEADNLNATSFLNIKTGEVIIAIPNKEFHFKSALMEEHFNENYMESEKYSKSEFKGKILDIEKYDFTRPIIYKVKLQGTLTIHGVTNPKIIEVSISMIDKKVTGETKFTIVLTDYNIQRPQLLWEKLSETIEISCLLNYEINKK
jgi:hypothetical protein